MFCPNCGTTIPTEQKYCRSCGLGLEKIAESLVEQLPTRFEESLQQRKERIERWGVAALSVFGVGILSLPLYKIVKMLLEGRFAAGLGFLALMIVLGFGLLSVILFAKASEVGAHKNKARLSTPEPLDKTTTAKLLAPEQPSAVASVTEATTELLLVEKKSPEQRIEPASGDEH